MPPPPNPKTVESAVIGISFRSRLPDCVYFAKLNDEGELYLQGRYVKSNYNSARPFPPARRHYLVNAPAGRYVVIGCSVSETPAEQTYYNTIFFSGLSIERTAVQVRPGTIAFMGEYTFIALDGFDFADAAQLHYRDLIAPDSTYRSKERVFFSNQTYSCGILKRGRKDVEAEQEFLINALHDLRGSNWVVIVQKRLNELTEIK